MHPLRGALNDLARAGPLRQWTLAWVIALGCTAWAFGALTTTFPWGTNLSRGRCAAIHRGDRFSPRRGEEGLRRLLAFGLVLICGLTLKPSNEWQWQPDVRSWRGRTSTAMNSLFTMFATAIIAPTRITHRIGNARCPGLSADHRIDLAIDYWVRRGLRTHRQFPIADAPPLCFLETRKTVGQSYSTIGGLYRHVHTNLTWWLTSAM